MPVLPRPVLPRLWRRPRYVARGGEQVHAHPITGHGCRVLAFSVPASRAALAQLCDRDFAGPSGGRVRLEPIGDRVLCVVARFDELGSSDPVDGPKGWTAETDVAFWVPVARVGRVSRRLAQRVGWYLPWVFVDVPWATIAGREALGLAKQVAAIDIADDDAGLASLRVSTDVLHHYDPRSRVSTRPVLEIERGQTVPSPPSLMEFARSVLGSQRVPTNRSGRALLPGLGLARQLVEVGLRRRLPLMTLKQFRDAADPWRACYQAVLECPCRVRTIYEHGPMLHRYRLAVHHHDSHPIARELGIVGAGGDTGTTHVELEPGWQMRFDFDFERGKELWRARG